MNTEIHISPFANNGTMLSSLDWCTQIVHYKKMELCVCVLFVSLWNNSYFKTQSRYLCATLTWMETVSSRAIQCASATSLLQAQSHAPVNQSLKDVVEVQGVYRISCAGTDWLST